MRVGQCALALSHTELPEVLASRAVFPHVVRGQQGKTRIRSTGAIREHGITGEYAEVAEILPKRIEVVGVGADAGDPLGVSRLYRAQGAAQRDDAAGAAQRNMIEPAQADAQMLG